LAVAFFIRILTCGVCMRVAINNFSVCSELRLSLAVSGHRVCEGTKWSSNALHLLRRVLHSTTKAQKQRPARHCDRSWFAIGSFMDGKHASKVVAKKSTSTERERASSSRYMGALLSLRSVLRHKANGATCVSVSRGLHGFTS
jgi:hypothetical protein